MKNMKSTSPRRPAMLAGASVLALVLGLGGLGGVDLVRADTAPAAAVAQSPLQSFADIVAANKPAVVTVTTETAAPQADQQSQGDMQNMPPDEFFRRFFGPGGPFEGMPGMPGQGGPGQAMPDQGGPRQGPAMALGSGFIISPDGTVVTNNHVVDGATKITVTLDDGKELPAKLIGRDAKNDIAVLKVESKDKLPTVQWGDSDKLRMGDPILAIGDPFGVGTTVTSGIVSARGRDLHSGPYDDFIQIDAAINHGNSGGPLVDASGKVVGINTAIYSPNGGSVGLGFAIPSAQAQKVVAKILAKGTIEHGFIGVTIQPVDDQIAGAIGLKDAKGALVATVGDGSPAAKAGVKSGDVIQSVNGVEVSDPKAVSRAIADLAPGDKAELAVWRDGKSEALTITVGKLDGTETASAAPSDTQGSEGTAVASLGLSVQTLTADDAQNLGLAEGTEGVLVTSVDPKGSAADKGIQQGDVIESVNQVKVTSVDGIKKELDAAKEKKREGALLMVDRHGEKSFVVVPFGQA